MGPSPETLNIPAEIPPGGAKRMIHLQRQVEALQRELVNISEEKRFLKLAVEDLEGKLQFRGSQVQTYTIDSTPTPTHCCSPPPTSTSLVAFTFTTSLSVPMQCNVAQFLASRSSPAL